MSRYLSAEEEDVIIALYLSGQTCREIGTAEKRSKTTIENVLKRRGIEMRKAASRDNSGDRNPNWKGGSYTDADGYVHVWTPTGHVREHRLITGAKPGQVVHHEDENPANNDPCNLKVCDSHAEHRAAHVAEQRARYGKALHPAPMPGGSTCARYRSRAMDEPTKTISTKLAPAHEVELRERPEFYCYDDETGFDRFSTAEQAEKAAEEALDAWREEAGDGWSESADNVQWGRLLPMGVSCVSSRKPAPEGSEFDEIIDYALTGTPDPIPLLLQELKATKAEFARTREAVATAEDWARKADDLARTSERMRLEVGEERDRLREELAEAHVATDRAETKNKELLGQLASMRDVLASAKDRLGLEMGALEQLADEGTLSDAAICSRFEDLMEKMGVAMWMRDRCNGVTFLGNSQRPFKNLPEAVAALKAGA